MSVTTQVNKAAKSVTEATAKATDRAMEIGGTATDAAKGYSAAAVETVTKTTDVARGYGETAVTAVTDTTSAATGTAKEYTSTAADSIGEMLKSAYAVSRGYVAKGTTMVRELPLGEKNVGERADATVDTVKEIRIGEKNVGERTRATVDKLDVDQLQDQVAKLRHQMEGVLGTWRESFRPSSVAQAPVRTPAPKKPAAKATITRAELEAHRKDELLALAAKEDLVGRSRMTKAELVDALLEHFAS